MFFTVCNHPRTLILERSISVNIYTPLKQPTRLYIKKLNNLYYFGKSTQKDLLKYCGSGKRWNNHFKKYGKENIETLWISDWYYDTSIIEVAIHFSTENNISKSPLWANIIPENGINGGGDCSQMHNTESWLKAKNTSNNKSQEEKDKKIKKAKETIFERYGLEKHGQIMTNKESIAKRNNTNLLRHGHVCAANKNGNKNSKESQKRQNNRLIVKKIKCLAFLKKYKLFKGWWYKSDIDLNLLFDEISTSKSIQEEKQYNTSQLKRNLLIRRKPVIILMTINRIKLLNLSKNWFQNDDGFIEVLFNKIIQSHSEEYDIALPLVDQYC